MIKDILSKETTLLDPEIIKSKIKDFLEKSPDILNDTEKKILSLRFGLEDNQCHDIDDISKGLKLTKQRIKQIETSALSKIKD